MVDSVGQKWAAAFANSFFALKLDSRLILNLYIVENWPLVQVVMGSSPDCPTKTTKSGLKAQFFNFGWTQTGKVLQPAAT
jgi:hypothetical protein